VLSPIDPVAPRTEIRRGRMPPVTGSIFTDIRA
jgi:hypothetical protein